MPNAAPSSKHAAMLSRLLFSGQTGGPTSAPVNAIRSDLTVLQREDFEAMAELARLNHVIVRALERAKNLLHESGDATRAEWVQNALDAEYERIQSAIPILHSICEAFHEEGRDLTVIKSLDHWPDLGSDLDLYTNTDPDTVIELMQRRFGTTLAERSWGDRLAGKWNFNVPGLPEAVEIHMGRLGQTGEQIAMARHIPARARIVRIGEREFRVTSISDRLMIATLQRMYRHFFFRLCDVVDTAEIADAGEIDYRDVKETAIAAGIWEGVATYLAICSDYVKQYRGSGLDLPDFVIRTARFGGEEVYFARDFLRVPILPQSARLYGTQLSGLLRRGEWHSGARLSLLPWLATAAAVGQKVTGSDKGIW